MATCKEFDILLRRSLPRLEIVSASGIEDVARVYVARTRSGDDTSLVEFVDGLEPPLPREKKWIVNISTQYGCPVKCVFCDAGHQYYGNLTPEEMLSQVEYVLALHPGLAPRCVKLKVHFARMGEPAFNDNVLEAIELLRKCVSAPGLWVCVPTVCPSGREVWFEKLLRLKEAYYRGRFQLQFSINTTDPEKRRQMMPVETESLEWMASYARRFCSPGDRKVVLNFALAEGAEFDSTLIVRLFDPSTAAVKLTPLNPTERGRQSSLRTVLRGGGASVLKKKAARLAGAGFDVILSVGDGREDEIGSNCGQSVRRLRAEKVSGTISVRGL